MYVAKTKALISFAVTAKLVCVFVFVYAKNGFLMTRLTIRIRFLKVGSNHNVDIQQLVFYAEPCTQIATDIEFINGDSS